MKGLQMGFNYPTVCCITCLTAIRNMLGWTTEIEICKGHELLFFLHVQCHEILGLEENFAFFDHLGTLQFQKTHRPRDPNGNLTLCLSRHGK